MREPRDPMGGILVGCLIGLALWVVLVLAGVQLWGLLR